MANPDPTHYEPVSGSLAEDWRIVRQIGHDLNNLLGAIAGFSEMLIEDLPADASLASDLRRIHETAQRATGAVHTLMDHARRAHASASGQPPAQS